MLVYKMHATSYLCQIVVVVVVNLLLKYENGRFLSQLSLNVDGKLSHFSICDGCRINMRDSHIIFVSHYLCSCHRFYGQNIGYAHNLIIV